MRKLLCAAMVVGLICSSSGLARADEQAGLKEVIEKAIVAQGGREKLSKFKAFTMNVKGKVNAQGMTLDMNMNLQVQEPDKTKVSMDMDVMGQKINVIVVYTADAGWTRISIMNETVAMSKDQLAEYKEQSYAHKVEALIGLNEKGYNLAPLGESKIGDNDVIGIRVSSTGHRDVSLYFDKKSHFLVKSETNSKDASLGDKEFAQETFYSEYKDSEGGKYASKMSIKRDGMEFMTSDITDYTPSEKLEDGVFAKP